MSTTVPQCFLFSWAWEELYMDCPEMFDSTRQIENWLSCRAGEGRNHKTGTTNPTISSLVHSCTQWARRHKTYVFGKTSVHPPLAQTPGAWHVFKGYGKGHTQNCCKAPEMRSNHFALAPYPHNTSLPTVRCTRALRAHNALQNTPLCIMPKGCRAKPRAPRTLITPG